MRFSYRRMQSLTMVVILGLTATLIATRPEQPVAAQDSTEQVAILATTVDGGLSSIEALAASDAGYSPVLISDSEWRSMTTADFRAYRAVVFGDPDCPNTPPSAIGDTQAQWSAAVTGNTVLIGTDPAWHANRGTAGGRQLSQSGIAFAAADPLRTGLYMTLSCYYHGTASGTEVEILSDLGDFEVTGVGCHNDAHIVATHPSLDGLNDSDLSGWSCSVHEAFESWPGSFTPLAIAQNAGDWVAGDGTTGLPYILARGATLDLPIAPGERTGGGVDDGRFVYVALGDSYQSGVGTENQRTDKTQDPCYRTQFAYPYRLFETAVDRFEPAQPVDFVWAACGGAKIRHVRSDRQFDYRDEWALSPLPSTAQIDHVPANADLITIGISGNDVGFSGIGAYCFAVARCNEKIREAAGSSDDPVEQIVASLSDDLENLLVALKLRAPNATIVLAGYPTLLSDYSAAKRITCPFGYSQLEADEVAWIQARASQLNDVMSAAAATVGVHFFDLSATGSGGERHGICGDSQYIHGPVNDDSDNNLHPSALGHAAYITELLNARFDGESILDLPLNPAATAIEAPEVEGPPFFIGFIHGGGEALPSDGDAVGGLPGDRVLGCLGTRIRSDGCDIGVAVKGAEPGADYSAWIYSEATLIAQGTVDELGGFEIGEVDLPPTLHPGNHTLVIQTTSAGGETAIFAMPLRISTGCDREDRGDDPSFSDVSSDAYFAGGVAFLEVHGITTGTSPTTYSPDDFVTRGQMATFLHRLVCEPAAGSAAAFADLRAGAFYEDAVAWLSSAGITTGTSPTTFGPNDVVTRAQMATFLHRLVGEPTGAEPSTFDDVPSGTFYEDAVDWLAWEGITTGTSASTFSPDDPVTRAQMAAFLLRLVELSDWTP